MEGSNGLGLQADYGFLRLLDGSGSSSEEPQDRLFFRDFGSSIQRELGSAGAENPVWCESIARVELHYYFACRAKNRLVEVLGLGKTEEGEFLSGEDASLLETLAGYLAVAIENVRLVESLAAKATQYERLQQFSENILESINVGLLALDLEDRVEAVNTPLQLIYPLPASEWRGKKLSEVLPTGLLEQVDRYREDAGIHNIYRYRILNRSGEERVLNIAIAPLLSKNCDCIGRLMIFEDVTEQVALETQLMQAEKLSSVGLLAAGVAHEVNTPLTGIASYIQLLLDDTPSDDARAGLLRKVEKQVFRASDIVNGLLNFSRGGDQAFHPTDLNAAVEEAIGLFEPHLRNTRILLERDLAADLPPVRGIRREIQQVVVNLLLNARDAMPRGGAIRVTTRCTGAGVELLIADTGRGIPTEHLHRIYDPFFTTKGVGRGTGLGLSVTYGIVRKHSGSIDVSSAAEQGTVFTISLPAAEEPARAAAH